MKFFITDESNITWDDKFEFFVYGGLVVDESEIRLLSKKLLGIKKSFNIKGERAIKWNNVNWNKEGDLPSDIHAKIKSLILELVKASDCKIILYLSPHDFYHNSILMKSIVGMKFKSTIDPSKYLRAQKYAMNVSLYKFNSYLQSVGKKGIVIADRFNEDHRIDLIAHCFSLYPNNGDISLDHIIYPLLQVTEEYSQIHQINDVVLGAITYSLKEMAQNFLPELKDHFWKDATSYTSIINKGINIYPKNIKSPQIRTKVERLKEKINRLLAI